MPFPFANLNNDDLIATVNNLSTVNTDVPFYTPFNGDIDDDETDHSGLRDADPDTQFYSELNNLSSLYFNENSFNQLNCISPNNFSLIHLNIHSFQRNFDNFSDYLSQLKHQFQILAFTETWLTQSNSSLCFIPSYEHVFTHRNDRIGGGVSIFISAELSFKRRSDLECFNDILESVFIEITDDTFNETGNMIIGAIYRPPNASVNSFNETLSAALSTIQKEGKLCYLTGDFNIDLLKLQSHPQSNEFIEMMYTYEFFPLITRPTRFDKNHCSLIDNIFCNSLTLKPDTCGAFITDISDHLPVFSIKHSMTASQNHQTPLTRHVTADRIENFSELCLNTDWTVITLCDDCNHAYSTFHKKFSQNYNSCFPLKKEKIPLL